MKRKSVLRIGAVLLSAGFVMNTAGGKIDRSVQAADAGEVIEIVPDGAGDGGDTGSQEVVEVLGDGETGVEQPGSADTSEPQAEIILPQKSVSIPVSEFLPVQERGELLSLIPHEDVYLVHIRDDAEMKYSLFFNQALEQEDVCLYRFDSEGNKTADAEPVQDVMSFDENNRTLTLDTTASSDYVLVISNAEKYKELGYTATITVAQQQTEAPETEEEMIPETESEMLTEATAETEPESEAVTENSAETEPESEAVTETVTETEPESEAVTETAAETEPESEAVTENETESESETETETESGAEAVLSSVDLALDPDLEAVPVEFLEYLSDQDVCSVTLVYADGSEKLLDKEDERYEWSVEHEDETDTDGIVHRTYHAVVKERTTGAVFEDTESVETGSKEPVEIKTEDMTTVILEGRKKWMMVQSVPAVSGRYAMNCDKGIEKIYYVSDDGELTCAEDAFQLQAGEKYTFLIKLK